MEDKNRQFDLPKKEEETLKFWEEKKIFEASLAKTGKGRRFVFYEGPPTANGLPHMGHFLTRAFKDVILRYKTMRGFFVPRRAGWDTHGLPVEIQVEKELGLKTKRDIEQFGIAAFNKKAKESVWRYKDEWERLTRRMGFWIDLEHPYITYEASYIEVLWGIIKEFWKKGLLEEDFRVAPWCTRCGTALSSHEVGQGYKEVVDTAVFVKFKVQSSKLKVAVKNEKLREILESKQPLYILSWTTTPWTLPGNVALAVNPELEYVIVDEGAPGMWKKDGYTDNERPGLMIVAKETLGKGIRGDILFKLLPSLSDEMKARYIKQTIKGNTLVGLEYEPLFDIPEFKKSDKAYHIYPADFVSATEGTGVVHTAVMYGEDDYRLGEKVGLPKFHTVDEQGRFIDAVGGNLKGRYVKDKETEDLILSALEQKGLLLAKEPYPHEYPHCWRCQTPLLYYARKAWWVRTTKVKDQLLANNEKINWIPEHIKHGRFGEFLKDVRDWAFSRERYWGTPLPIWKCDSCGETEVVGSVGALALRGPKQKNRYLAMRHGEAVSNIKKILSSDGAHHGLTLRGKRQVEAAIRKLKKEKIDMIVSSPVRRARETADAIGKALGVLVETDTKLREINVGALDGRPVADYLPYVASPRQMFDHSPPGGETLADVRARMGEWLKEMERAHEGKTILAVSHQDPIWLLASYARGETNEAALQADTMELKTAGIAEIKYRASLPRDETGELNLHRPYVDEVMFPCKECGRTMRRIPEVADVWFDSGAMPFASAALAQFPISKIRLLGEFQGFARQEQSNLLLTQFPNQKSQILFPADYICEGVDMTRGWFYTLLAVATLRGKGPPYHNVISLGHVLDKNGFKMSKSKGNVVNPWDMMSAHGADALRWYFYTVNAPGDPKRFDEKDVLQKRRSFINTLWNSFVLFDTYVKKIQNFRPDSSGQIPNAHVLDRWIMEKRNMLVAEVTKKMDAYDITGAARAIEKFAVSDFSQWYLRRSRRRFQQPSSKQDFDAAARVAAGVLETITRLSAPFAPFLAEAVWQGLRKKTGSKESSIHLFSWPEVLTKRIGSASDLLRHMEEVRRLSTEGLRLRAEKGIKVRQPLRNFQFPIPNFKKKQELLELIKDEVNVKEITSGKEIMLDTTITPELKEEGVMREIIRNVQEMRRDAGLKPGERMRCFFSGSQSVGEIMEKYKGIIRRETYAAAVGIGGKKPFRVEREIILEGEKILIGIK